MACTSSNELIINTLTASSIFIDRCEWIHNINRRYSPNIQGDPRTSVVSAYGSKGYKLGHNGSPDESQPKRLCYTQKLSVNGGHPLTEQVIFGSSVVSLLTIRLFKISNILPFQMLLLVLHALLSTAHSAPSFLHGSDFCIANDETWVVDVGLSPFSYNKHCFRTFGSIVWTSWEG